MENVSKVLTALNLCGSNYYAGACKKCPFIKECMPGENDALIDAAAEAITDLVALNAFSLNEQAKLVEVLKYAKVTVYIVAHRQRRLDAENRAFPDQRHEEVGKNRIYGKIGRRKGTAEVTAW